MNCKKFFLMIIIFLSCFCIVGCNNQKANDSIQPGTKPDEGGNDVITDGLNRKVYYMVQFRIELLDLEPALTSIGQYVKEHQGYIEKSSESTTDEGSIYYATYTYRIPTENLNEFLKFMDGQKGVKSKNISSNDITSNYSQTEERIKTLNASKEAYLSLLQKGGLSMGDIISINSRIEDIDTEVKTLESIKAGYDNLLDYSTITMTYSTTTTSKSNFFTKYLDYLGNFFVTLFTIILYIIPFAFIAGVIAFIILAGEKARKKKRNQNQSTK